MQIHKNCKFWSILKSQIYDLLHNFVLWTVNRTVGAKCVTLHSDFVKMSYALHIKIKFLAPTLLGDFKNFLIPPRIWQVISNSRAAEICRSSISSRLTDLDRLSSKYSIVFCCCAAYITLITLSWAFNNQIYLSYTRSRNIWWTCWYYRWMLLGNTLINT